MARKPKATQTTKASPDVAEPELSALDVPPAPVRRGRPRKIAQAAPPMPDDDSDAAIDVADADLAIGSETPAENNGVDQHAAESPPANETAQPPAVPDTAASKPAAQWDQAAETAHFDWPEIERTASQQGPNQVMAKLLIAARAEGANSRWPF